MKKTIFTILMTLLLSVLANASGKFIFKPEYNNTKEIWTNEMGLSVHQKLVGPLFWTNWTGVSVVDSDTKLQKDFKDFTFKNGIMIQPLDKLQIEVGHEFNKDLKTSYYQNLSYLKISAQLW